MEKSEHSKESEIIIKALKDFKELTKGKEKLLEAVAKL